jgi:RecA-family ATPase
MEGVALTNPVDQARRYVSKIPGAVSGSGGHNDTFQVACVLVQGFGLSVSEARPILEEFNSRCQPAWSEKELDHKLTTAAAEPGHKTQEGMKPRGHMVRRGVRYAYKAPAPLAAPSPVVNATASPAQASKSRRYDLNKGAILPEPVPDGTRALLRAAFQPGEGIRIAQARTGDDGRELPKDAGTVLTLEDWLTRLDKVNGDPNKFMRTTDRNGIFVTLNPMKPDGKSDKDVTAFRHALIEFDNLSASEQWDLIHQSRIPCTAVISSGGKSLHAWVRVDAKDRAEYDQRVKLLYEHFDQHQRPDEKNRNPSRFSRLTNCMRGNKRQELLSLACGAESFTAWAADLETDGAGHALSIDDLLAFKPEDDSNTVLGSRWLCRGGSCLFVGQSGIGKSSLAVQKAVCHAVGRTFFGITAARPLRSLFIQAENDDGDLAEMVQGVTAGLMLTDEEMSLLRQNLIFIRDTVHTGYEFAQAARRLIDKHKPDLVWFDPLLSFIGDDISKQSVCSQFLRTWLGPISEATGVVWMVVHHTNKPPADPKARRGWTSTDHSYMGTGSSELTNWARAVCVLQRINEDAFELKLAKRGKRAGARSLQGAPTSSIWLKYADNAIRWEQIEEPPREAPKKGKSEGGEDAKPGRKRLTFDCDAFIESIRGEFFSKRKLAERASEFSGIGPRTIWKSHLDGICKRLKHDDVDDVYHV